MKIESVRDKLLTNYEVLEFVNSIKQKQKRAASKHKAVFKTENLETIVLELQGYLKATPAGKQSPDDIRNFIEQIAEYGLEKAELLQIINVAPTSAVTLHALIEECDSRLTDEQRDHILEIVAAHLHPSEHQAAE
ncbi:RNA polymerase [Lipomyces japonicus]|uniref:RNA polymerase n=1 Tax=Lipomyces japonicus TaxID=56871 RepID=UPI0034CFEB15